MHSSPRYTVCLFAICVWLIPPYWTVGKTESTVGQKDSEPSITEVHIEAKTSAHIEAKTSAHMNVKYSSVYTVVRHLIGVCLCFYVQKAEHSFQYVLAVWIQSKKPQQYEKLKNLQCISKTCSIIHS